jgi:hypothetical protein
MSQPAPGYSHAERVCSALHGAEAPACLNRPQRVRVYARRLGFAVVPT